MRGSNGLYKSGRKQQVLETWEQDSKTTRQLFKLCGHLYEPSLFACRITDVREVAEHRLGYLAQSGNTCLANQ
jgi:hypothetical protein